MRRRSTIDETPRAGPTEILCDIIKHGVINCSRCSRELAESGYVIANIRATRNIGIHELSKKGVI